MNPAYHALVASYGALALVSQVILLRQLLVAFHGSELILALVMAAWLAGIFIGARLAGRFARGLELVPLTIVWISTLTGLLFLTYHLPALTVSHSGEIVSFEKVLLWVLLVMTPASSFAGALFVASGLYYNRTVPDQASSQTGLGGLLFALESSGSCLGLLVYTFFLAGRFGPFQNLLIFMAPPLTLLVLTRPGPVLRRYFSAGLICLATLAISLSGLAGQVDTVLDRARFKAAFPAYRLLETRNTKYQHLALAERGDEFTLFGNLAFIDSWPDPYSDQRLALFFLTQAAGYDHILLAGQGPGGFIPAFLQAGVKHLTYVALDASETDLIRKHLSDTANSALDSPRLNIVHGDLRAHLRANRDKYELIVLMTPDPENALINRLFTLEFFRSAAENLTESGVLITAIDGAENFWSRELLSYGGSLYDTLSAVFTEVVVTPGDRHFFIAGMKPGIVSDDPDKLAERYRQRGFSSPYFKAASFKAFFPPTGLEYIRSRLSDRQRHLLNTDARPVSYYLKMAWWEKMAGPWWLQAIMAGILQIKLWAPPALLLMLWPYIRMAIKPDPIKSVRWIIFTTGFFTMVMYLGLAFWYQSRYGVLYHQIGLLTAVYMAGLTAGGIWGRKAAAAGLKALSLVRLMELLLAGLAGLAWCLIHSGSENGVLPLIGLTGLAGGLEFALAFSVYLGGSSGRSMKEALSHLEASDHAGAMVGALITGLVLAPVAGLTVAFSILFLFKIVGFCVVRPQGYRIF